MAGPPRQGAPWRSGRAASGGAAPGAPGPCGSCERERPRPRLVPAWSCSSAGNTEEEACKKYSSLSRDKIQGTMFGIQGASGRMALHFDGISPVSRHIR
ncbi:uncharacterized protein LOC102063136 [Zonotrichia albicollis]|uniref:uncharacterized protein LOC102063136 n=1 Tax=Zonotrichia albicollis TaxID=44394 RepID=UPI003D80C86E